MEVATDMVADNTQHRRNSTPGVNLEEVPIKALRYQSLQKLSKLLNYPKILLSETGLPRDWRGIAHLAGLKNQYGLVQDRDHDPMAKVLRLWSEEFGDSATIGELKKFLELIDRYDVEDDLAESMEEDSVFFTNAKREIPQGIKKVEDTTLVCADSHVITNHDVARLQQGQEPQKYDAFVLFADEDIDFATELIERMEAFGLTLCVKERDLVGGIAFEHEAIMRLISERCNRLVIVVSPNFFRSPANSFFVNFAAALGIEQRRRKIVPCVYRACELPPTLSFYFLLYYERSGRFWNFWDKLRDSLQTNVIKLPEISKSSITEIALVNDNETSKKQISPCKLEDKEPDQSRVVNATYSDCNKEVQKVQHCSVAKQMFTVSECSVRKQTNDNTDKTEEFVDRNSKFYLKRKWYEKFLFSNFQKQTTNEKKQTKAKKKKTKGIRKKVVLEDT